MEIVEAIKTRRSIRRYKPEPVGEEEVNSVLEAARWAPSWANTQCWRFIVVRDGKKKGELAETLPAWNTARSAIEQAPVLIMACAELGHAGFINGVPSSDKGDWYMFDVALAMQNLVLAAHSLGLGTVHVGAFDAQRASHILQVPEGVVVVEMTPLGYPGEEGRPPQRKPPGELVFQETYGQK